MTDVFCSQYQSKVQLHSHILYILYLRPYKFLGAFRLVNQNMSDYMLNSIKSVR